MRKFFKITFLIAAVVIAAGYLIPERKAMPCCTPSDYNHQSFWHWPWTRGENGHPHTGIDIFGKVGAPVVSQTGGLVIYAKEMPGKAGKSVFVLGPKWRIHEYLHLHTIDTEFLDFVKPGERLLHWANLVMLPLLLLISITVSSLLSLTCGKHSAVQVHAIRLVASTGD